MKSATDFSAGAQGRNRTTDTVIFSHVLYQLSYLGALWADPGAGRRQRAGVIEADPGPVQNLAATAADAASAWRD